jgi:hypothetical protein
MIKQTAKAQNEGQADRIMSPKETYKTDADKTTTHRKRILVPPAKPSRIGEKAIVDAIEKVMARRPSR